jgi:signal transduction histidine kinase
MVVFRAQEIHRDQEGGRTQLRFQVEDTGPGIPEEELEVIFDPFGQGSVGLKAGGNRAWAHHLEAHSGGHGG